jgi:hypothetical protein
MWKKIAIAGGACAVVIGLGTAALATSGSPSSPGAPSSTSSDSPQSNKPANRNRADKHRHPLRRALHAQWVTRDKDGGAFVTHDAIRGKVTAVSPTSITIEAADNKSETYTVNGETKVRIRTDGKGAKGAISQVHTGDMALVVGTGTSTLTARGVVTVDK